MSRLVPVVALLSLLACDCASCGGDGERDGRPDDAGADADTARDAEVDADPDDGGHGDADSDTDGDRDADDDALPPPVPMELVEVPHDREGLDCGPGCRQVTFADPILPLPYDISSGYIVYTCGGDLGRTPVYLVNLESQIEYRMEECTNQWCMPPAVDGSIISFVTAPRDNDTTWTIWRYELGDSERFPLVHRNMTNRARPLDDLALHGEVVTWYDSFIHPAGIYAMNIQGGDVMDLTPEHCLCFGSPNLFGRQVVFEGWQTGSRDIWMTNIDTLEQEDLVDHPAAQFDPAFDGQWVVWTDGRNDPSPSPYDHRVNPDIYGMEMATRTEEPLCDHPAVQLHPDVHDGLVVWEDFRNAEDPNNGWDSRANIDIYLLDLETRREVQVTNLPGPERGPRVWGRRVFFVAEDLIGQTAVFMVDLDEAGLLAPDGD